jgi:hypothetical protein
MKKPLQPKTKQSNHLYLRLKILFFALISIFLDVLFNGFFLMPFFSYGFVFYLVLSDLKYEWVLYSLVFGISLDLSQNLPLGYYLTSILVCCGLSHIVSVWMKKTRFQKVWIAYALIVSAIYLFQFLGGLVFLKTVMPTHFILKYILTWTIFPLQMHIFQKGTTHG